MVVSGVTKYAASAIWMLFMYLLPLLIFTKGLLLRRDVLPNTSFCTKDDFSVCYHSGLDNCAKYYNITSPGQYCAFSHFKVILIFIDALRYDFTDYKENLDIVPPYLNKLDTIRDLLKNKSSHARLFKFIADPPSTTMQRIKGLTTGSLPTFIEIGSNFFSSEIDENNIIDVLKRENKSSVFLGDDTWMKLYPNRFLREYPFDSFNVWDLDSVDNGVRQHLIPEMRKPDWHFLIAHFLGVDHCGHRYGPSHPEMARKLTEMNTVLRGLISEISSQEDVMLFVIGDHGMTFSGNHGGETENELNSALFVYSPVHPLYSDSSRSSQSVRQVDLVPTLSSVLGVSIPFSNTGCIILECLPRLLLPSPTKISFILWQSIEQLTKYIIEYSFISDQFENAAEMKDIREHYEYLKEMWFSNNYELEEFVLNYNIYTKNVVEMFQKAWIHFNFWYISIGNILMALTLSLNIALLLLFSFAELMNLWLQSYKFAVQMLYSIGAVLLSFYVVSVDIVIALVVIIEMVSIYKLLELSFPVFRRNLRRRLSQLLMNLQFANIMTFIIVITSFGWLFSNSYILEEAAACFFLLVSYVLASLLYNQKQPENSESRINITKLMKQSTTIICVLIIMCLKVVSYFVKCREEQDYCRFNSDEKIIWKHSALLLMPVLCFVKFEFTKSLEKNFKIVATVRILCTFILFLFWGTEIFLKSSENYAFFDKVPAAVFLIALFMLCFILFNPARNKNSTCFLKNVIFANKFSTFNVSWTYFHIYLSIIFTVIAGLAVVVPMTLMFLYLPCLAVFSKSNISDTDNIPWNRTIVWGLSAIFWFYATGHNALFSSIQWDAAFLFQKNIGNNMIIPSILVTMNTFSSFIIHGFLLLYLLMPQQSSGSMRPFNSKQKEKFYFHSFLLVLQYVTFFAIRIFGIMLCCTVHSRHLMMWMIFAPKFIFETASFVISAVSATFFGFVFASRLSI